MPKTCVHKPTATAASLALAAAGLFVPAPAFASPPCAYYVQKDCERWQYFGYQSWDDCIYWEMQTRCPDGAAPLPDGGLLPAIRDED